MMTINRKLKITVAVFLMATCHIVAHAQDTTLIKDVFLWQRGRQKFNHADCGTRQLCSRRKSLDRFDGKHPHGDHTYVSYQKPVNAHNLPLVFVHGVGQFSKTWETTPDGREGFQNIFLRRGFETYIIDQPRCGRAGQSIEPTIVPAKYNEQLWFNRFRLGI